MKKKLSYTPFQIFQWLRLYLIHAAALCFKIMACETENEFFCLHANTMISTSFCSVLHLLCNPWTPCWAAIWSDCHGFGNFCSINLHYCQLHHEYPKWCKTCEFELWMNMKKVFIQWLTYFALFSFRIHCTCSCSIKQNSVNFTVVKMILF